MNPSLLSRVALQAAAATAQALVQRLIASGARPGDIRTEARQDQMLVIGDRSAGATAEFGNRHQNGTRRFGRAIEALRSGDIS